MIIALFWTFLASYLLYFAIIEDTCLAKPGMGAPYMVYKINS